MVTKGILLSFFFFLFIITCFPHRVSLLLCICCPIILLKLIASGGINKNELNHTNFDLFIFYDRGLECIPVLYTLDNQSSQGWHWKTTTQNSFLWAIQKHRFAQTCVVDGRKLEPAVVQEEKKHSTHTKSFAALDFDSIIYIVWGVLTTEPPFNLIFYIHNQLDWFGPVRVGLLRYWSASSFALNCQ